jgi:hypothetical protein
VLLVSTVPASNLADVFQLYSPRWLVVGRIELERIDPSQVILRFCLPAYPTEAEIEFHERAVRDALPPPAAVIRIMDAEGDRVRTEVNDMVAKVRALGPLRINPPAETVAEEVTA